MSDFNFPSLWAAIRPPLEPKPYSPARRKSETASTSSAVPTLPKTSSPVPDLSARFEAIRLSHSAPSTAGESTGRVFFPNVPSHPNVPYPNVTFPNVSYPNVVTEQVLAPEVPIYPTTPPNRRRPKHNAANITPSPVCTFCKNNGCSPAEYKGHLVKDPQTKLTTCPVLMAKEPCNICGASGEHGHTRRYCPLRPVVDLPKKKNASSGQH